MIVEASDLTTKQIIIPHLCYPHMKVVFEIQAVVLSIYFKGSQNLSKHRLKGGGGGGRCAPQF